MRIEREIFPTEGMQISNYPRIKDEQWTKIKIKVFEIYLAIVISMTPSMTGICKNHGCENENKQKVWVRKMTKSKYNYNSTYFFNKLYCTPLQFLELQTPRLVIQFDYQNQLHSALLLSPLNS